MASDKVIGGPFDPEVLKQLKVRSNIMSKPVRDDNTIRYLSSKTGWVKMTSSVQVNGHDDLAQKYILIGGTYGRVGEGTYSNFYEGKGFRPMPGITGVEIKAINRFGLLKEATVTYNCWDVSQLQELEQLFMRPGFSVLLEWGHSTYYTTDTDFRTIPQTVTKFFTKGTTKEDIYDEIETLKQQSGHNYDGIYGFIKNFSWSFRADGGYDCVTTLTSIGEIIESLQIDVDNPLPQGASEEETTAKSEEIIESKVNLAKILKENPNDLAKDPTEKSYIGIGDAHIGFITYHCNKFETVAYETGLKNLHDDIDLKWLIKAVGVFPESPAVKGVLISIGTKGGFSDKMADIRLLKAALERVFPNAKNNLIVVKGSYGWGVNIKKNGVTEENPKKCYKKYEEVGFTVAPSGIGYMAKVVENKPNAPYDETLAIYKFIATEVEGLIKY